MLRGELLYEEPAGWDRDEISRGLMTYDVKAFGEKRNGLQSHR